MIARIAFAVLCLLCAAVVAVHALYAAAHLRRPITAAQWPILLFAAVWAGSALYLIVMAAQFALGMRG